VTTDQIDHLNQWLSQHKTYLLSLKFLSKRIFLEIQPKEPTEDENEVFYVPISEDERNH